MKPLIPFLKLFKQQLRWLLLGVLLALVTVLASVGLLSLSGWFISTAAFVSASYALASKFNFFIPAGGVRLLSMLRIVSRYGDRVVSHQATFKLLTHVRVWFYQKLEPLAPAHLMQYRSADLLVRLVSDVEALENLYIRIIMPSAVAILTAVLVFLFFGLFSWPLASVVLVLALISGFTIPLMTGKLARRTSSNLAANYAQLKSNSVDYIQGLAELKTFAQDELFLQRLTQQNNELLKSQKRMSFFSGMSSALMTLMMGITVAWVAWMAVGLVSAHIIGGAFIAFFVLGVMALFEAIMPLPTAYQYLGKTVACAERLLRVVRQKPAVTFPDQETRILNHYNITYEQINFSYQGRNLLFKDFSFKIAEGTKLGIAGATGCGKSTLIHLLARFWEIEQGRICIGGVNIAQLTEAQLRETVMLIEQRPHIFNTTIRYNLLIANQAATEEQIYHALRQVELEDFVKQLPDQLHTWVGEQGRALSGGQRKRLALARAILKDAPILVLDEPTEGLDKITQEKVIGALEKIMPGKTVLLISHKPKILARMDKVLNLNP